MEEDNDDEQEMKKINSFQNLVGYNVYLVISGNTSICILWADSYKFLHNGNK